MHAMCGVDAGDRTGGREMNAGAENLSGRGHMRSPSDRVIDIGYMIYTATLSLRKADLCIKRLAALCLKWAVLSL